MPRDPVSSAQDAILDISLPGIETKTAAGRASKPSAFSPTRVNTFIKCPLQFRLQNVDRLPTKTTDAQIRGTLVHAILEHLFDLPPTQRTLDQALDSIETQWLILCQEQPTLDTELFATPDEKQQFFQSVTSTLQNYFELENPSRLQPAHRELNVETVLDNGLRLRGIIDRVDQNTAGLIRIVDYKTGKAPRPQYLAPYLLQLRFYALVWYQLYGTIPTKLQLLFLKDQQVYNYSPSSIDLEQVTEQLWQIWEELKTCIQQQYFPPRRQPLCNWCDFKAYCPIFGGETPAIDQACLLRLLSIRQTVK